MRGGWKTFQKLKSRGGAIIRYLRVVKTFLFFPFLVEKYAAESVILADMSILKVQKFFKHLQTLLSYLSKKFTAKYVCFECENFSMRVQI